MENGDWWYRDCTHEQLAEHIAEIGREIIRAADRLESLEAMERIAKQALENKEA